MFSEQRLMQLAIVMLAFTLLFLAVDMKSEMAAIRRMKRVTVWVRETETGGDRSPPEPIFDDVAGD